MAETKSPLRIDIVSDVMCPWCIIGYRQLALALEASDIDHEIHWHPFELNPNMPPEGQDISEHLAEKYGTTPEQSVANRVNMTASGKELGFDFNFVDGFRMHNTFHTHQLLHWANEQCRKHDLKLALFIAHFTHGRNLSDDTVLAEIAGEIGLDREDAKAVLVDQRFANTVRQEQQFWVQKGISGVPAVVFDHQHLVSGAQGVDNFQNILTRLQQQET
jgi:predicted DsbA family dithiol-disulfide isomerase